MTNTTIRISGGRPTRCGTVPVSHRVLAALRRRWRWSAWAATVSAVIWVAVFCVLATASATPRGSTTGLEEGSDRSASHGAPIGKMRPRAHTPDADARRAATKLRELERARNDLAAASARHKRVSYLIASGAPLVDIAAAARVRVAGEAYRDLPAVRLDAERTRLAVEAKRQLEVVRARVRALEWHVSRDSRRTEDLPTPGLNGPVSERAAAVETPRRSVPEGTSSFALTLTMTVLAGAGIGGVLGLVRDAADTRLHDAIQFRQFTGLPLMSTLPHLPDGYNLAGRTMEEEDVYLSAFVIEHPDSPAAAAVVRAWSGIEAHSSDALPTRILLLTGSGEGEGKSTVALNLALAATASGHSVLLVDADLPGRRLSTALCDAEERGVAEVLCDAVDLDEEVLIDLGPKLTLLPAGKTDVEPCPAFAARKICQSVAEANPSYSYVIVDGGLVANDPVAREFAESADDIVVVCGRGRSLRTDVCRMMTALAPNLDRTRGLVLTIAT